MKHVVIYVPGLGDSRIRGRQWLVAGWYLYGVRPVVHKIGWADGEPFQPKLDRLVAHIDQLSANGSRLSLVGESAGASAVIHAVAQRQGQIHRAAFICGQLRGGSNVSASTRAYNPAFAESLEMLGRSMASLPIEQRRRMRSVHPLRDHSVPIKDTFIAGAEWRAIPAWSHFWGIVLGDTAFSWRLVPFLKRP